MTVGGECSQMFPSISRGLTRLALLHESGLRQLGLRHPSLFDTEMRQLGLRHSGLFDTEMR